MFEFSHLPAILNEYETIGLSEIDSVRLMNRTDTKYIFPVQKLPEILKLASKSYRIQQILYRQCTSH
jgi:hypothetical protein